MFSPRYLALLCCVFLHPALLFADANGLHISEFLASNDRTLLDEDGDDSDWIELHNPGASAVQLDGYYLTDSAENLTKWRIPAVSLPSGGYLVIFASAKDRANPASELHTNFSLSADGEYLALVAPDGVTVLCDYEEQRQFFGESFGNVPGGGTEPVEWVADDAPLKWLVPAGDIGTAWRNAVFDDSAWTAGTLSLGFGYPGESIGADVSAMYNVNGSVYVRIPFNVANASAVSALTLSARFDDGFAAFLNGEPVASFNAPASLNYNSGAQGSTTVYPGTPYQEFGIDFSGHLQTGDNVLSLQVLNLSPASSDLLMDATLTGLIPTGGTPVGYLATQTPGAANDAIAYTDYVRDTKFDVDRGFFDAPVDVTITCSTPGATIVYTTDGNSPSLSGNVGTAVTAPDSSTPPSVTLNLSSTTVLRAAAFKSGLRPSNIDTQTYLFLESVLDQPVHPAGYPLPWIQRNGSAIGGDYEMDQNVVGPVYSRTELKEALLDIPTISIVTDIANLFDQQTGIQVNPTDAGEASERRVSVEMLNFPDGEPIQLDAGMRMNGNASRSTSRPKHNFRLAFRNDYGAGRLEFPLFGDNAPTSTFNQIILRGGNGNSWIHPEALVYNNAMYIRDQWFRDARTAMGYPEALQSEVHVYFNGLYWGMHHLFERIEEEWAAERFGGTENDWEGFRIVGGNNIEVIAGTPAEESARMLNSWAAVLSAAQSGNLSAVEQYLDLDSFIDYLVLNFHAGNNDWDQNNVRAMRRLNPPGKYMFFCHDSERAGLNVNGSATATSINVTTKNNNQGPTGIHQDLRSNPEYAMRFADRAYKHLFNGGALTPENGAAQWAARADGIRKAMKAESARWGDFRGEPPRTLVNWEAALQREYTQWFPIRTPVTVSQFRNQNIYPDTEAPEYSQRGGIVPTGFALIVSAQSGDVYFTTDGSDPRLTGGGINPDASLRSGGLQNIEIISAGSDWNYLDDGIDQGTAWRESAFDDSLWASGPAPLGFGAISITPVVTQLTSGYPTYYFRKMITISGADSIQSATAGLMVDDGAVVYINGVEAFRDAMPSGTINYNTGTTNSGNEGIYDSFAVDPALFVEGVNTIAVEVHNLLPASNDLGLDMTLNIVQPGSQNSPVILTESSVVKARTLENGEWSPLNEVTFIVGNPASSENIAISEIHYNPQGADENTEFIELVNISDAPVTLAGCAFTDGIGFTFPLDAVLAAGERVVLVNDLTAFESLHGGGLPVAGEYSGNLDNGGEQLTLTAADDSVIHSFEYDDDSPWPTTPDGDGASLVLIRPFSNPDHALPENWRPESGTNGTPGTTDAVPFSGTANTDADGNGFDDLLDYAFGYAPGTRGDAPVIALDGDTLNISIPYALAAEDAEFFLEWSDDLETWNSVMPEYGGFEAGSGPVRNLLWSLDVSGFPQGYARIRVQTAE